VAALAPPVAAVRNAVRRCLADALAAAEVGLREGDTILVACSGGADSLALASAARFEGRKAGLHCGLVTVDHGLQDGSADRAASLARWARRGGFEPTRTVAVEVNGGGGPEAAARDARYAALVAVAKEHRAPVILLGHTRDDQAETVLLALARGAGPRGLSGMPERRVRDGVTLLRPLLDVARADTRAACAALGLTPWDDPHNGDPAYARSRIRAALPTLVAALGADVVDNLARTARLLAADAEALDALAATVTASAVEPDGTLRLAALDDLPAAIRTRVLHGWAKSLGVNGAALSHRHVDALDALVTRWHGQGPAALPGGIEVQRRGQTLTVAQKVQDQNDHGPGNGR
jgi:tRNA(Ile)-lysidine synthase